MSSSHVLQVAEQALLQRAGMDEIKVHPWFKHQLPEGALRMNAWYTSSAGPCLAEVRPCPVSHATCSRTCCSRQQLDADAPWPHR